MQSPALPLSRDLVLIGGGHTHALVLRKWGMNPLPGARLTVINPGPTAAYSGMLPGYIAGHYDRAELDIDLIRLARFANARIITGAATAIDLDKRTVQVPGRPDISFDVASLDIGITSEMPDLTGFADHAVPAKPLGRFAREWRRFLDEGTGCNAAVIGAGVAGAEIAMAFAHALHSAGRSDVVHLVDQAGILETVKGPLRARLLSALKTWNIRFHDHVQIASIDAGHIRFADGAQVAADFICGSAGAHPQKWLQDSLLELNDGFVSVNACLQSSDADVFAVGDCAHMTQSPRPKAGVYAVRQADTLFHNLRVRLRESGTLRAYSPQKDYLKLVSLGGKAAIGDRFGMTFQGGGAWRVKDHIDRAFMRKFHDLPAMPLPAPPTLRAAGSSEVFGDKPMCGGCGSKIGRNALQTALSGLPVSTRRDVVTLPGDDSALLLTNGAKQVISTDHLRAFVDDPVTMTRITANHALGDIWAMAALPQAATVNIILPRMSAKLAERTMREIMETAHRCFGDAGAAIVGGHSSQGAEMTIGFTITGLCDRDPITLGGAEPGDHLILTKPIGTGVIMAGAMSGEARGDWVENAVSSMVQPQSSASDILSDAQAMTDVTGFGLAGHVQNICQMSGTGADLDLNAIPILDGAGELARLKVRSTLFPENRALWDGHSADPRTDLLFDPQTAGGLLAAIKGDPTQVLTALKTAGYPAAHIGVLTEIPGQLSIR